MKDPFYEAWYEKSSRAVAPWRARIAAFMAGLRVRPGAVLTRHFFNRLFQNDVFPFEDQMKEKLYLLAAMVAALGWFLANALFSKYMFLEDHGESWLEKCHFILFFMLFLAFATVLEWDVLFLDRRDYSNLMPLPVKLRTVFFAKFASFFVFVLFFSAAVNSLSLMAPAFFLVRWISNQLSSLVIYALAQVVALTAAFVFVFFLFVFVVSVLLVLLSPRIFRTVSFVIRFGLLVGCVFLLMMFLVDPVSFNAFFTRLAELKSRGDPSLYVFPPFWFTGLYEILIGRGDAFTRPAAVKGLAAILVVIAGSFSTMAVSYRRHTRRTLEVRVAPVFLKSVRDRISGGFDAVFLRHPVERAVFHFFGKTIARSPLHKVRLAGYLAFALGFIFILLGIQKIGLDALTLSNLNLLAGPLILSFFLLVGLRSLVNVPIAAEANWIFRMTEWKARRYYFIGLKKAVFFYALLPMFATLFVFYACLWGPRPAIVHSLYGLVFALLLREILFWKYAKIPFACLVVPGKSKMHLYWLGYVLGFVISISGFCSVERWMFRAPENFIYYFATGLGILVLLSLVERLFIYKKLEIVYEEEPEPVLITLM